MKNKITDLNNYLFCQIERLSDESLTDEQLSFEVARAKAISSIASQIVSTMNCQINAFKIARAYGDDVRLPLTCGIDNEGN